MKAVIYARYSSDRQRAESIEDQIRVCSEFAQREGLEIVGIYADAAQSGTSDRRDEFQRMVEDSASADWQRVIVYKLDRFARDRYASAIYRKKLRDNGAKVLSATESIPDTPEGILMESLIEGFGEYYSKQLAQNVLRGMEGNARKCLANGVRLYGYETAPDGTYKVKEPEASHIREAFRMRADGYKIGTIATELSLKMGKTYKQTYNLLRDAFHNPKYKGDYVWGDVYVPDGMPSIVTASEWEDVQRMRGNVRTKSKRAAYPLAGRVFDSDGKRFHGESAKSGRYHYYSDGSFRIRCDVLEPMVAEAVRSCLEDERLLDRLAKGTAAAAKRYEKPSRTVSEIEREMENLTETIAKVGADEAMLRKVSALRIEREEAELAQLKQRMSDAMTEANIRDWIRRFAQAGSDEALDAFVERVLIEHEGNEVESVVVTFTWYKTSEPLALEEFALDEFGTPCQKYSNYIYIYEWGFAVVA